MDEFLNALERMMPWLENNCDGGSSEEEQQRGVDQSTNLGVSQSLWGAC